MRLDVCLVERGLAKSRTLASRLIADGSVSVGGRVVKKASYAVSESDEVTVGENELFRYVSRGGLKLCAALDAFEPDVRDLTCFDFGSSTGGFCDCLLQKGVRRIFAVDVGKSQLDETIRTDVRVACMEETDARGLSAELLGEACDLGVMDVSFISQSLLYPAAARCLKEGAHFVTLFKPQFEVGKRQLVTVALLGINVLFALEEKCLSDIMIYLHLRLKSLYNGIPHKTAIALPKTLL